MTAAPWWWAWAPPGPGHVAGRGAEAWEDGDCPWCRSLFGPVRGGARPARAGRVRLLTALLAALAAVAALMAALA